MKNGSRFAAGTFFSVSFAEKKNRRFLGLRLAEKLCKNYSAFFFSSLGVSDLATSAFKTLGS